LALARVAEESGYERYWFAEHHNSEIVASSATAVLIGYVADNTQRIRVGSGGVMLPNHSPLIIAEQFGTLGQLYPSRIDLGLGRASGTDSLTAQAIRSDSLRRRSFPKEVQKIQDYFSLSNGSSKVRVAIAEGIEVPIYILGSSTDSAHLAKRFTLCFC
jgi:luciferase family oxidoreductase group 1